jgi:hypothetical protein
VLGYEKQVGHFLVDEVVIASEVILVDVRPAAAQKKRWIWWVPSTRL